ARHAALADVLPRCSLLVGGVRAASDDTPVAADETVDVLPPFAGG
ncbi:MAG: MoaD/ThiS family protein, partial [Cellulosimicrobium funkei]